MDSQVLSEFGMPQGGIGLCLSGGGYRAMLFHLGALWRLNEAGLLSRLDRISSVSGGSIIGGYLGCKWRSLQFDPTTCVAGNFDSVIVSGIRALANVTIDLPSILKGVFLPWSSVGAEIANQYDRRLFNGATLQELPDTPRFVINASNLQSGALWRFEKPYMADWKVGRINTPEVPLALAVAASSAFPPILSPVRLRRKTSDFVPDTNCPLQQEPYTTDIRLTDGGVYDNLGLESVFKHYTTVFVSDAGQSFCPDPHPPAFWPLQLLRVLVCIDNQVRSLRKRDLMEAFQLRALLPSTSDPPPSGNQIAKHCAREGAYWGIATHASEYTAQHLLDCPLAKTKQLARISTRLAAIPNCTQESLINWGYAACDLALRTYYLREPAPTPQFPYPRGL